MTISLIANGQDLTLGIVDNDKTTFEQVIDSLSVQKSLNLVIKDYRASGYFGVSVDSLTQSHDTIWANIRTGQQYKYILLDSHNITEGYLPKNTDKVFDLTQFKNLQDELLITYEANGYPFAQLVLSENRTRDDTLISKASFYPGMQVVYDSLMYYGKSKLSKKYVAKYLDTEVGALYNESDVLQIDKRLRNLPLIKLTRPSQVIFTRGKASIILYIDDVITDRIDGVVGVAPNSANTEENNLLLTGEINLELNNLLKSAKQLHVHWRNYLQRSQKLDMSFTYPYLFNTKLGINGEFDLNKFDTLFLNLKSKLSFRYQQKGNNYIQFYYQNINSALLTTDTNQVRSLQKLPENNPYKIDNYGFALFQQDIDYLPNPRRGYSTKIDLALGQRTILRNTEISAVKFYDAESNKLISIYDTTQLKSLRGNIQMELKGYIPIRKRSTLFQKVSVNTLIADQYFFNELYNFGGYSSLRGFDENEFFASKTLSYTAEYRYLIGPNSHVGLFVNAAAYENEIDGSTGLRDIPYGFGATANIQVGKGILNLAYALGTQQDNPIQIRLAKFHFGVVNYF